MEMKRMSPEDEHMIRSTVLNHFSKMLGDLESKKMPMSGMVIKSEGVLPPEAMLGDLHDEQEGTDKPDFSDAMDSVPAMHEEDEEEEDNY